MCAKPPIAILTRSGAPEGLIVRLRFLFRDQILAKNVSKMRLMSKLLQSHMTSKLASGEMG